MMASESGLDPDITLQNADFRWSESRPNGPTIRNAMP
jgi:hypothetical protein